MSISQSSLFKSASLAGPPRAVGDACPVCDQPIPHDRFDEIKDRIEARQAASAAEITSGLQEQFGREKASAIEQAQLEVAATLEAQVASAREEERRTAEADANEKAREVERVNNEAQSAMRSQLEQAEAAKSAAEESGTALKAQLEQMRLDSEAAIRNAREEAEANAATIRIDAVAQAEAGLHEKIAGLEHARHESEADLQARITEAEKATVAAQQSTVLLQAQLERMRLDGESAVEKAQEEADARVATARQEATVATEAAMHERVAGAELAKAAAEAKALAVEEQMRSSQENHEAQLALRLQEQREALERASTEAVNAEKSAAFEKELRLSTKVEELQRALDNKTAEELGEGAELDLYEMLKGEFDGDRIERINKGQPGADILQSVIHNGKECGSIIYDSKNHNAWRNDFVTKLAADQMAAKADHAILSTRKFPAGARHLDVRDGVILAAPSRVAAVVHIVRQHIVQTHTLRLSDHARAQKTALVYDFITSQRCNDLFTRFDTHTDDLLDLQVKEVKAHEVVWKKQGELIRSVQKVRAEICNEIEIIIGGVEAKDEAANG